MAVVDALAPLWVPLSLIASLVGLGGTLGWIWGRAIEARHARSREALPWNEGYGVGYLQGLRDAERVSR